MNKVLKHRNLMGLLFVYILAIPFLSVLSRCCYVILNKNAYQSYASGEVLDDVFEYSISHFISENSFGRLDFFQWFSNLFIDSSNNLYIHYINWYMNYALYVSLAFLIFMVLMWFINFARKLLERGMDVI